MHLVDFSIRIYHDARSSEYQNLSLFTFEIYSIAGYRTFRYKIAQRNIFHMSVSVIWCVALPQSLYATCSTAKYISIKHTVPNFSLWSPTVWSMQLLAAAGCGTLDGNKNQRLAIISSICTYIKLCLFVCRFHTCCKKSIPVHLFSGGGGDLIRCYLQRCNGKGLIFSPKIRTKLAISISQLCCNIHGIWIQI